MRYLALAVDYDGTLATHGRVPDEVLPALQQLIDSGRKLLMVTGRELGDLTRVFPQLPLFTRVVAENGGVLCDPATGQERALADAPPRELVSALRDRAVEPLSVGRVVLASSESNSAAIQEAIKELGLEYELVFNKGALMVLPSGVNKQSGLLAALRELHLSGDNVVGVGDAENDQAFLDACGCAVAVANALPALKERADLVTRKAHGEGVVEVIERLVHDDLASLERHLPG